MYTALRGTLRASRTAACLVSQQHPNAPLMALHRRPRFARTAATEGHRCGDHTA
jgi:hypothetical protein